MIKMATETTMAMGILATETETTMAMAMLATKTEMAMEIAMGMETAMAIAIMLKTLSD